MKNSNIKILSFSALIVTMLFLSCDKDSDMIQSEIPTQKSTDLSIGEIHNYFLTHTMNNFDNSVDGQNLDEGLTSLASFQSDFMDSFRNAPFSKEEAQMRLLYFKNLYITENVKQILRKGIDINNQKYKLNDLNDLYVDNGIISSIDGLIINNILFDINANLNGNITYEEMYENLLTYKSDWDLSQNSTNQGGDYSYMILDISINSLNWWKDNALEANDYEKIAPWVASDIVGAIAGAGLSVGLQHFLGETGEINWSIVAGSAIAGAITGSTGVIGKVGKWISDLF